MNNKFKRKIALYQAWDMFMATLTVLPPQQIECKECRSMCLLEKDAFLVCADCGLVQEPLFVYGLYKMLTSISDFAGSNQTNTARISHYTEVVNTHSLSHGAGLGSCIGYEYSLGRVYGNGTINARQMERIRRLKRKNNLEYFKANDEVQKRVLQDIYRICSILRIPKQVKERACFLTKEAITLGRNGRNAVYYNRPPNSILLAVCSLIYAIKKSTTRIRESDIISLWKEYHDVDNTAVNKTKSWMQDNMESIDFLPVKPQSVIPIIISEIMKSEEIISKLERNKVTLNKYFNRMKHVVRLVFDNVGFFVYGGRDPFNLVASCCYSIETLTRNGRGYISQSMIAKACNIAEPTIRDHHRMWKRVIPELGIL